MNTSTNTMRFRAAIFVIAAMGFTLTGCGGSKQLTTSGFLADYSKVTYTDKNRMRYISPALKNYTSYIVDPVQMRIPNDLLKPQQRAEVGQYFHLATIKMFRENGFKIVSQAGVNTARVRLAITDIHKSTWWLNIHPGSKLTGAGTGGASMEGEIIDSVTGVQIAAVVQSGRGNQFELDTFSALDDVKDTIDKWVKNATKQLKEMHQ